jgi:hypothetical protein
MSIKFKDLKVGDVFSLSIVGELSDINRKFVKVTTDFGPYLAIAKCLESNETFYFGVNEECIVHEI